MTDLLVGVGSISGVAPVKPGSPVQWMGSDEQDDPNLACGYTPSLDVNNTQLYQFDAVAYESVIIGLFSIITAKTIQTGRGAGCCVPSDHRELFISLAIYLPDRSDSICV
jgi:hypothetical protein